MQKLKLNISEVFVLERGGGPDLVYVTTTFPSPFPLTDPGDPLTVEIKVASGEGKKYVKEVLHLNPTETVSTIRPRIPFSRLES